ncbi:cytochrome P450 [Schizopora paradoxa]|uniref:Cytochrome P450 n=1 Tax=Schizopora paradoxa TaxID=27342 RepID=A0A0H2S9Z7_9AGAM|nr:cytochrome P450 [Schizopora paradoxa]
MSTLRETGMRWIEKWLNYRPMTVVSILMGFACAKIVYRLYIWPYFLSPMRHAPGPPLGHPIYGQWPEIIRNEAGVVQREWAKKYGPTVRAIGPVGVERMTFLNPEAMHKILISDCFDYPRPKFMRNILGLTAGFGLLTNTGDVHKQMRKALNPAFSVANLTAQTDMYYEPINSLVKILKAEIGDQANPSEGKIFTMYDWLSKVTLDIICLTAFGYDTDSLHNPDNELADAYHHLLSLQSGKNLASLILLMSVPGFPSLMKTDWLYKRRHWFRVWRFLAPIEILLESMRRIKTISSQILRERTQETASLIAAGDNTLRRDIMSLLVEARLRESKDGFKMDDAMMLEHFLTFLGAGHETTASGIAWTLWLLAINPEVQQKLREEVRMHLANNPTPDYKSLKQMEYLEHVVMEALRLYPPVPMTLRKATKNDYIDGIMVMKGTIVYIPIRVVNTYQGFWGADAEEFRPERWEKLPDTIHPTLSFMSFIAGPHHCIGKTMAVVEMKAVLAILISQFSFEPAYPGQKAKPTTAITMKPEDDLPLRVKIVQ